MDIFAGGIWGGDLELRALALKLSRSIIVIAPKQVCYYPWDQPVTTARPGKEGAFPWIGFSDGGSSIQKKGNYDLPDDAFDSSSIILMYNGTDHFWAT